MPTFTLGAVSPERGVSLVGDSLAVGLTGPLSQELAQYDFHAASKGGTDMKAWLTGFMASALDQVLAAKPGVVLVSLGTNDTAPASQPNADTIKARAAELAAKIRAAGAEPVWLMPGTLPWSTDALVAAVNATGVRKIEQPRGITKPDKIHPDGAGYKIWSKAIAEELKSVPATGVSKGVGLFGGLLIVAAAVGLLWATLNVGKKT